MRAFGLILFLCCLAACEQTDVDGSAPLPPIVKCKPTWDERTLINWRQRECKSGRNHDECVPMGRTTILVEFIHDGCRSFKEVVDNQASLIQGYSPNHAFVLVTASSDALTRSLFDHGMYIGAPCRAFFFDDTMKPDRKLPNEDQWFVELCKDATSVTQFECGSQLSDKRLYTP